MRSARAVGALACLGALALFVACADIAGLESSEPPLVEPPKNGGGSSTSSGGEVTTDDGIAISPANLDLKAPCDTASDPVTINLNNRGTKTVEYEVKPPDGSIVTIREKDKGMIAPGELVQVKVGISAPTPMEIEKELIVTTKTDGKTSTKQLPIKAQVRGALLVISPPLIDFGDVRQNTASLPQPIEITNDGNEPTTITSWAGTGATEDFKMSTGSITIAPGQKGSATVTFTAGNASDVLNASYQATTLAAVCGSAKALSLKGRRVNTNVTVSPALADFGGIDCNTSPNTTKPIVVTNYATMAAVVNLTFQNGGTKFTLNKTMFTVPAAGPTGKTEVNFDIGLVKPVVGNPGGIADSVKVDITGAETSTKNVTVNGSIEGAILDITPTALMGFSASTTTRSFTVRNKGNKPMAVKFASSNGGEFSVPSGSTTLLDFVPFDAVSVDVKLNNTASGQHTAMITTSRADVLFGENGNLCAQPAVVTATADIP